MNLLHSYIQGCSGLLRALVDGSSKFYLPVSESIQFNEVSKFPLSLISKQSFIWIAPFKIKKSQSASQKSSNKKLKQKLTKSKFKKMSFQLYIQWNWQHQLSTAYFTYPKVATIENKWPVTVGCNIHPKYTMTKSQPHWICIHQASHPVSATYPCLLCLDCGGSTVSRDVHTSISTVTCPSSSGRTWRCFQVQW